MNNNTMQVVCRFSDCNWAGHFKDLLAHCEAQHKECIIEINDNVFNLSLVEMLISTLLLIAPGGLYWYARNRHAPYANVHKAVFAIGNSEMCEYTLQIGQLGDQRIVYLGPLKMFPDSQFPVRYNVFWTYEQIWFAISNIQSQSAQVIFGPHNITEQIENTGKYVRVLATNEANEYRIRPRSNGYQFKGEDAEVFLTFLEQYPEMCHYLPEH